ncbi:UNVERIFIED_CONTAM: hypothetical protein Sradi_0891400 [Sesamum radiatum]|uniref:Myb/SANT-like domain-containing protein n=1 Tax=Sesamum radiatum TaxID=300843 RepID=A0AAW2V7J8_SESRA
MMSKSGLSWDDSRCMVTVDSQDVWDDYCKIDPTTRTTRYKTWSFFLAWRGIFGKDRANGEVTRDANKKVDPPPSLVDNDPTDCYVPMAEWCPNFGYFRNDSGVVLDK